MALWADPTELQGQPVVKDEDTFDKLAHYFDDAQDAIRGGHFDLAARGLLAGLTEDFYKIDERIQLSKRYIEFLNGSPEAFQKHWKSLNGATVHNIIYSGDSRAESAIMVLFDEGLKDLLQVLYLKFIEGSDLQDIIVLAGIAEHLKMELPDYKPMLNRDINNSNSVSRLTTLVQHGKGTIKALSMKRIQELLDQPSSHTHIPFRRQQFGLPIETGVWAQSLHSEPLEHADKNLFKTYHQLSPVFNNENLLRLSVKKGSLYYSRHHLDDARLIEEQELTADRKSFSYLRAASLIQGRSGLTGYAIWMDPKAPLSNDPRHTFAAGTESLSNTTCMLFRFDDKGRALWQKSLNRDHSKIKLLGGTPVETSDCLVFPEYSYEKGAIKQFGHYLTAEIWLNFFNSRNGLMEKRVYLGKIAMYPNKMLIPIELITMNDTVLVYLPSGNAVLVDSHRKKIIRDIDIQRNHFMGIHWMNQNMNTKLKNISGAYYRNYLTQLCGRTLFNFSTQKNTFIMNPLYGPSTAVRMQQFNGISRVFPVGNQYEGDREYWFFGDRKIISIQKAQPRADRDPSALANQLRVKQLEYDLDDDLVSLVNWGHDFVGCTQKKLLFFDTLEGKMFHIGSVEMNSHLKVFQDSLYVINDNTISRVDAVPYRNNDRDIDAVIARNRHRAGLFKIYVQSAGNRDQFEKRLRLITDDVVQKESIRDLLTIGWLRYYRDDKSAPAIFKDLLLINGLRPNDRDVIENLTACYQDDGNVQEGSLVHDDLEITYSGIRHYIKNNHENETIPSYNDWLRARVSDLKFKNQFDSHGQPLFPLGDDFYIDQHLNTYNSKGVILPKLISGNVLAMAPNHVLAQSRGKYNFYSLTDDNSLKLVWSKSLSLSPHAYRSPNFRVSASRSMTVYRNSRQYYSSLPQLQSQEGGDTSPIQIHDDVILFASQSDIIGVSSASGERLWSQKALGAVNYIKFLSSGDQLYITYTDRSTNDSHLVCMDRLTGYIHKNIKLDVDSRNRYGFHTMAMVDCEDKLYLLGVNTWCIVDKTTYKTDFVTNMHLSGRSFDFRRSFRGLYGDYLVFDTNHYSGSLTVFNKEGKYVELPGFKDFSGVPHVSANRLVSVMNSEVRVSDYGSSRTRRYQLPFSGKHVASALIGDDLWLQRSDGVQQTLIRLNVVTGNIDPMDNSDMRVSHIYNSGGGLIVQYLKGPRVFYAYVQS